MVKNIGRNLTENSNSNYIQKLLDHAKNLQMYSQQQYLKEQFKE